MKLFIRIWKLLVNWLQKVHVDIQSNVQVITIRLSQTPYFISRHSETFQTCSAPNLLTQKWVSEISTNQRLICILRGEEFVALFIAMVLIKFYRKLYHNMKFTSVNLTKINPAPSFSPRKLWCDWNPVKFNKSLSPPHFFLARERERERSTTM